MYRGYINKRLKNIIEEIPKKNWCAPEQKKQTPTSGTLCQLCYKLLDLDFYVFKRTEFKNYQLSFKILLFCRQKNQKVFLLFCWMFLGAQYAKSDPFFVLS